LAAKVLLLFGSKVLLLVGSKGFLERRCLYCLGTTTDLEQ
jgi:hypothetical protein